MYGKYTYNRDGYRWLDQVPGLLFIFQRHGLTVSDSRLRTGLTFVEEKCNRVLTGHEESDRPLSRFVATGMPLKPIRTSK